MEIPPPFSATLKEKLRFSKSKTNARLLIFAKARTNYIIRNMELRRERKLKEKIKRGHVRCPKRENIGVLLNHVKIYHLINFFLFHKHFCITTYPLDNPYLLTLYASVGLEMFNSLAAFERFPLLSSRARMMYFLLISSRSTPCKGMAISSV